MGSDERTDWESDINPAQDGHFRGCSRMGVGVGQKGSPLHKICHTYPTMRLGSYTLPKKDPQII